MVAVRHAAERAVVEALHLRAILEDDIVEGIQDSQLQLELLEEGQGLLDGQPVSYVLLRSAQQLTDGLPIVFLFLVLPSLKRDSSWKS